MTIPTVADLATKVVETLAPDDDVDLADLLMRLDACRHLPVLEGTKLVGIVSKSDILRTQMGGHASDEAVVKTNRLTRVADIMTREVVTVSAGLAAAEAGRMMSERGVHCLPVMEHQQMVGILTESDFVKWAIARMDDMD